MTNDKKNNPEANIGGNEKEEKETALDDIIEQINDANYYRSLTEEERKEEIARVEKQLKQIRELKAQRDMTDEERGRLAEETEKEIAVLKEERKKIDEQLKQGRPVELYYAKQKRREAENVELRKLQTDNSDELISFFEDAFESKDKPRCGAIFRKLCMDANENEIINYYGYPSTFEGIRQFGEEILVKKLGMGTQEMLSLMSDCSYINESRKHWDTARIIGVKSGIYYWLDAEAHVAAALAEIRKMQPRVVARDFNRLAYGGETPQEAFNPAAGRDFKIGPLGIGILLAMADSMAGYIVSKDDVKKGGKGEMPANTIGNLYKALPLLRQAGVSEVFCEKIQEAIKLNLIKEDLGPIVETAIAVWKGDLKGKGKIEKEAIPAKGAKKGAYTEKEMEEEIRIAKKGVERTKDIKPEEIEDEDDTDD